MSNKEKIKDLKYWRERGGQIEWRLEFAESEVATMKRDLKECDEMISKLKPAALRAKEKE